VVDYSQLYPGKRVVEWMEVCLDGMAPDWLSQDAAKVTGRLWTEVFGHCSLKKESSSSCFVDSIVETLRKERNSPPAPVLLPSSGRPPFKKQTYQHARFLLTYSRILPLGNTSASTMSMRLSTRLRRVLRWPKNIPVGELPRIACKSA
jgi:hypothetical protein